MNQYQLDPKRIARLLAVDNRVNKNYKHGRLYVLLVCFISSYVKVLFSLDSN